MLDSWLQFLIPAGNMLPAEMELRDALGNLIADCQSTPCRGVPTTMVHAQLLKNSKAVNSTALKSDEGLEHAAVGGRVSFSTLRVEQAGLEYSIVFTAAARGPSGTVVRVETQKFHITNGAPSTLNFFQLEEPVRGADLEVML